MRYDRTYETLANRALGQTEIDLETYIANAIDLGMDPDVLQEELINDLASGGPLFGKFLRNLEGAAGASVGQAHRQGIRAGELSGRSDLDDLLDLNNLDIGAILDSGDPSELDRLDATTAPVVDLMWVAELINTCHMCLPLHGTIRTAAEWARLGLHPATIHSNAGWNSPCHCRLVDSTTVKRSAVVAPLRRVPTKSPAGLKIGRRTVRAVAQQDLDKAIAARDKAMDSLEGRRTLRRAGMSNK